MQAVDSAANLGGVAQAIADAGYAGVCRYLAPQPNPKVLTAWELEQHFAAGNKVLPIWETYANRPGAGYDAGAYDANFYNDMLDALGWPATRPAPMAVDYEASIDAIAPYFQGALDVGRRPVGIYADYALIEHFVGGGILAYGWQCAAWSYNGSGTGGSIDGRRVSAASSLYQKVGYVYPGGVQCDVNEILRPDWGAWHPDQPPDQPPEDTVANYMVLDPDDPNGGVWEIGESPWRRHVKDPDERDLMAFLGMHYLDESVDADFRRKLMAARRDEAALVPTPPTPVPPVPVQPPDIMLAQGSNGASFVLFRESGLRSIVTAGDHAEWGKRGAVDIGLDDWLINQYHDIKWMP